MSAIITMGGTGSRFREAGYNVPKYQIELFGHTLFEWSMLSLRQSVQAGVPFVFIVRAEDNARSFIERQCTLMGIDATVVEIDKLTDGQATTVLAAKPHVAAEKPFFIYNIDTFVHPDHLPHYTGKSDGWIPCFPGEGAGWSFVRLNDDGHAVELREKVRISDHATIGLYWFGSFAMYEDAYARYYANPANMERGEKYVAPLYNQLIADGRVVTIAQLPADAIRPMGTPAEIGRLVAEDFPPFVM